MQLGAILAVALSTAAVIAMARGIAGWLHHALESYKIPSNLVGTTTSQGEVPRRLTPIFKDRDELPATHSLGEAIETAIGDSDALIVLCSPEAKGSPWVDKEVERFKQVHGDDHVTCCTRGGAWLL